MFLVADSEIGVGGGSFAWRGKHAAVLPHQHLCEMAPFWASRTPYGLHVRWTCSVHEAYAIGGSAEEHLAAIFVCLHNGRALAARHV